MPDLSWYNTLIQPPLTPPWWVFAPAWSLLYTLMLVSLFLFSIKKTPCDKSWGYTLFFSQLGMNLCWTPVFFSFHNIGLALTIITVLDTFIILNIIAFFKVSKTSGLLLIPYFVWTLFATYLNAGIFVLN